MKRFFFKTYRSFIINIQLIILLSFIFAGCKEEDTGIISSGRDRIRFTFTVGDIKGSTRANAEGIDNIVADDQIIAVCFDKEEKQIGIYYPEAIVKENDAFSFIPSTDDEIATIVLLPNWSSYLSSLPEVADKNALLSVISDFNYTGQEEEYLPMYGETEYNPATATPYSISLERKVSKIVIRNCMDDYDLTSATLKSAADKIAIEGTPQKAISGNSLSFMKGENGDLYLYVPPTILGEEASTSREILLTAKHKEDGTEENCTLWLKNYKEEEEQWTALDANTLYTFNVQGIDTETPPVVEQYNTVIVKWAPTYYGKFETYDLYLTSKEQENKYFLFAQEGTEEIYSIRPASEIPNGWNDNRVMLSVTLNLQEVDIPLNKIRYHIVDLKRPPKTEDPITRWDQALSGNLMEDASWFDQEIEGETITLHLTSDPISPVIDTTTPLFPITRPYRIYWKTADIAEISKIEFRKLNSSSVQSTLYGPIVYGKYQHYNYAEFIIPKEGQSYLKPFFNDSNGKNLSKIIEWGTFTRQYGLGPTEFFPQEIDGETYYVFFVD